MKSLKSKIMALFTIACMFTGAVGVYANTEDGTTPDGQNQTQYKVDFGTGSWDVNGASVMAVTGDDGLTILKDIKEISEDTVITLTGFNADTMEARVSATDGFAMTLNVVEGKTSLSAKQGNGVYPDMTLSFSVVLKSPTENPPSPGDTTTYTVNFGTGEWNVDNVKVTANKAGNQTLKLDDVIELTNFNPDTMEAKVSAADGFSVALNVVEGKTSLSARQTEGGYPGPENALTFSVGTKSSEGTNPSDPPQGTEDMIESSLIVTGSIDMYINDSNMKNYQNENSRADSVKYTHKETEENVTIRVANFINERYTKIIINGTDYAKSLPNPTTVEGREAMLNALQDQIYVYTFTVPFSNEYVITAEKEEISGDSPYSLIGNFLWSYDEENSDGTPVPEDQYIGNGKMELLKIFYDGKDYVPGTELPSWIVWGQNEHGGSAVIPANATVTVKMIPDYGYQLMNLSINDQAFKAEDAQSVFTFTVKKGNFHLGAKFEKTDNLLNSDSDIVKDGSVTLNGNVINQGTVIVNVKDGTGTQDFENELPQDLNGYHVNNVVDIGMDQVWYKGTDTAYWAKPITDLGGNSATVTITVPQGQTGIQVMHERHDGTYEVLKGTKYNSETGELTFTTDSFSRFALAYDTKSFDECKTQVLTNISNIRTDNDSDAIAKLLRNAETTVKALIYDVTKTPEANNEAVNAIFAKLTQDLTAQQIKEAKAAFEAYKTEKESYILALQVKDDPQNVRQLIIDANKKLTHLGYDETKSLSDNKKSVDKIVTELETNIRDERLKKNGLTIPLEGPSTLVVNVTNSADNTLSARLQLPKGDVVDTTKQVCLSLESNQADTQQIQVARGLLTESLKTYQIGTALDLNLYQYSNFASQKDQITELAKDVTIQLTIPDHLINMNTNVTREFSIGRIHTYANGQTKADILPAEFDATTGTLKFETDRFSTYVIMYRDIPKSVPDTSDHSNTSLWMAVLMLSGIVAAGTVVFRRKRS